MKRLTFLAMLTIAACVPQPDLDAERAAILAADSAWLAAARAGDVEQTLGFWTEDAWIVAPGQPPHVGHAAIRQMLSDLVAMPGFSVTWETTDLVVAPAGDVAYSLGTNAFTVPNAAGGLDTLHGQGVVVWRKGDDGRWRSAVDIWNAAPEGQ